MKATSIEQIREHLAKGGRALAVLKDGRTDEVKRVDMGMLRVYAGIWSSSFACVDIDHWQLLPLEEKEPVPVPRPARTRPRTEQEWREYAESQLPSKEQLRDLAKTNPPPQEWFDDEPVDHGTPSREWLKRMADAEDECTSTSVGGMAADTGMLSPQVQTGDLCEICGAGFLLSSGRCDHCDGLAVDHGTQKAGEYTKLSARQQFEGLPISFDERQTNAGGWSKYGKRPGTVAELLELWDTEGEAEFSQVLKHLLQAYERIEELEGELAMTLHTIEEIESPANESVSLETGQPDGTQKRQEEKPTVAECERCGSQWHECFQRMQRIRTRLLHGVWPEMSDLLAWWEATTGERIEWGKRCERCKASGRVKRLFPIGYDWITCLDCNGSGYSVRPTWMNQ